MLALSCSRLPWPASAVASPAPLLPVLVLSCSCIWLQWLSVGVRFSLVAVAIFASLRRRRRRQRRRWRRRLGDKVSSCVRLDGHDQSRIISSCARFSNMFIHINQLFVVSHVKQLSMWLVIVLLSGVYTFSQFPLLLLMLRPGYTLYLITHLHIRIRSISSHTLQSNSTIECFFVYLFLSAPPTQMSCWRFMLAFRVVFLLYLFIFVAGSAAAAAAGCNRRSEDPNTFAAYAFLYAIYVCVPASLCPFLFISFSFLFVSCLCPFRWVAGSKSIMLWGNCVKVVV